MKDKDIEEVRLRTASFLELYEERNSGRKVDHDKVGPYEHRAFVREVVAEQPVLMALAMGVAIPAYTAAKVLSTMAEKIPLVNAASMKSRSRPSFAEVKHGFAGIAEGLETARHEAYQEDLKNPARRKFDITAP